MMIIMNDIVEELDNIANQILRNGVIKMFDRNGFMSWPGRNIYNE